MKRSRSIVVLALCVGLAAPAFAQSAAPTAPEASPAPAAASDAAPADGIPAISPEDAAAAPAPELQPMTEGQAEEAAPAPMVAPAAIPAPAPAPVVAAPPPAEPTPADEAGEEGRKDKPCALGKLCMGPVASVAVINLIGFGAHARYGEHFGFGLDYQFMPTLGLGDVSAGWSLVTVEGRWYPFGGAFFLGGGFAYQEVHMAAKITTGLPGEAFTIKGNLSMPAFKFGLGLMGHDGFVMGIDLALEVPLGGTNVNFTMPPEAAASPAAGMVADAHNKINDAANKSVKMVPVVPQINLLRIGYLF
jgi:hypothetical protein